MIMRNTVTQEYNVGHSDLNFPRNGLYNKRRW